MHISNFLCGNLCLMSSNLFSCHISHFHVQLVVFLTTGIFTCSENLLDTCQMLVSILVTSYKLACSITHTVINITMVLLHYILFSVLQPVLYSYWRSSCSWRVRIGELHAHLCLVIDNNCCLACLLIHKCGQKHQLTLLHQAALHPRK